MLYEVIRYKAEWKPIKGDFQKELQLCPRCFNLVRYLLVQDKGLPFLSLFERYNFKRYAFKCPICPNAEQISPELAKAIIKGA